MQLLSCVEEHTMGLWVPAFLFSQSSPSQWMLKVVFLGSSLRGREGDGDQGL